MTHRRPYMLRAHEADTILHFFFTLVLGQYALCRRTLSVGKMLLKETSQANQQVA
jgi:hypothetical protein